MGLAWTGRTRIRVLEGRSDSAFHGGRPDAGRLEVALRTRGLGALRRDLPPQRCVPTIAPPRAHVVRGRGSQDGYRSGESGSRGGFQGTVRDVRAGSAPYQQNPTAAEFRRSRDWPVVATRR